jgi:hypothetical protein
MYLISLGLQPNLGEVPPDDETSTMHTTGMHTMVLQWHAYHGITMVGIQWYAYHCDTMVCIPLQYHGMHTIAIPWYAMVCMLENP